MSMRNVMYCIISLVLIFVVSCRKDEMLVPSTENQVTSPNSDVGDVKGFFLLNEGNMGSNKSTLDYFDYESGVYSKNIYSERNPSVAYGLGDVGNDIQIYQDRIYAVINCSNLVEVMSLSDAKHIGAVSIPNCRYIAFKGDFAYVSSYAGAILGDNRRLGYVAKVDLRTLEVVGECEVGYQPEDMAVVGDKLYVANSGGYNVPDYDNRLSVIDLDTFTIVKEVEVAMNLHRLEVDDYGCLWISSRGDYGSTPSRIYILDTESDSVVNTLHIANNNMAMSSDLLYVINAEQSSVAVVDVAKQEVVCDNFITDGTDFDITVPYGIAVNHETNEIFITDAKSYVTPGKVYCYAANGVLKWSATTGDIPSCIAFTSVRLGSDSDSGGGGEDLSLAYITEVFEYRPAPGQYVNKLPEYAEGDTQEMMNQKVLATIGSNKRGMITLGGYGGYVTVGFDQTIENVAGKCDFRVLGNAFSGGSEPGVIMVSLDTNKNGIPDDEWYEIAGSAHVDHTQEIFYNSAVAAGNDTTFYFRNFEITYSSNHTYYPKWITDNELKFSGSRLPQNGVDTSGTGALYVLHSFRYGYADNVADTDDASAIDISWAIDSNGNKANLSGVDFIKIYTGVQQDNGWIGECSTEVCGVENLHILNIDINSIE